MLTKALEWPYGVNIKNGEQVLSDLLSNWTRHQAVRDNATAEFASDLRSGIWIYGAGQFGQRTIRILRNQNVKLLGVIDRIKAGRDVEGFRIISPIDFLAQANTDTAVLITVFSPTNSIIEIAESLESKARIFYPYVLFWHLPTIGPQLYLDAPQNMQEHANDLLAAYLLLQDQVSREVFLRHFAVRLFGRPEWLPVPQPDQYFPKDLNWPPDRECLFDVGAFTGDTLKYLVENGQSFKKCIAFEPDPINVAVLWQTIRAYRMDWVRVMDCAIGESNGFVGLTANGAASSISAGGSYDVVCHPLDEFADESPTYIKMDVEGYEATVLKGAKRLLNNKFPALAVCLYHRPADLWEIPLLLNSWGYGRFHLRLHSNNGLELVLYAARD